MSQFSPMLASRELPDLSKLAYPLACTPKLDGVRALIKDGQVLSRSLKPIPNKYVQQFFAKPELTGFDGELILNAPTAWDCYRQTVSIVMSQDKGISSLTFFVFDVFNCPKGYLARVHELAERFAQVDPVLRCSILPLTPTICDNAEEVLAFEKKCLDDGFEGLILRSLDGSYKNGRATLREGSMMKLKRFVDGEAVIIGFEEKMHNGNPAETNELGHTKHSHHQSGMVPMGTLGALLVKDIQTNVEFSIGTGFDDELRQHIWANQNYWLHVLIKYKHFPSGGKDKPRHPVYLGTRVGEDM